MKCSYCRVYHLITPKPNSYIQFRSQTTTSLSPLIKKTKHKSKKFTELLEVINGTVINRRAVIRTINPTQLSSFVNKCNIPLNENSKINAVNSMKFENVDTKISDFPNDMSPLSECNDTLKEAPYNLNKDVNYERRIDHSSVIEDLESSGISDTVSLIKNSSLMNAIPRKNNIHSDLEDEIEMSSNDDDKSEVSNKKTNESREKKNTPNIDQERLQMIKNARQESMIRTLNAYLQVCISCGMIGRAYCTIMYYRKKSHSPNKLVINDINLYNILLQAYATHGNLVKWKEIMNYIEIDGLEPTAKTYATAFECYRNSNDKLNRNMKYLYLIQSEMRKRSITFDDILNESKTKLGQYECVLSVIHLIKPGYVPVKNIRDNSYKTHLFDKINSNNEICKSPAENLLTLKNLEDGFKIQLKNEKVGHVEIKSVESFNSSKPLAAHYKKVLVDLENNWRMVVSDAFDRDLKALKRREYKPIPNAMVLYPLLCVLNKKEYINATLREIRKLAEASETFSPSFSSLCKKLGKYMNVKHEILENMKNGRIEMMKKTYLQYCDWYINRKNIMNSRIMWQKIADEISPNLSIESQPVLLSTTLQRSVGEFLYEIILKDIKIDVNCIKPESNTKNFVPAFYKLFRANADNHLVEEIKPHPILAKIYRESQPETLNFDTTLMPSLCPPRPWSSIHSGGYTILKSDVVRIPIYANQQFKRLNATPPSQLWPSLDSLNQLSSIPWTVNNTILDIIIKIFRDGGSVQLNVPQSPSVLASIPLLEGDSSKIDRKRIIRAQIENRRKKNEMYSLWCDALYRLSLANHFRNKIFWLPHNMDFRGRVYPIPPHLNHLGSDLARSILIFALGKPLGPNGLDWLKIHTINLTGFKKRESIKERLRYANEIIDKIKDSAENPLTGEMWWAKSDEPWQTLAACKEIASALKSPDPAKYICHLPIHQDGSCNGLQHYAALGRDQIGAMSVNLYPSDLPQDVYSSVATMVDDIRRKDAAEGNNIAQILEGFITRKVIKQTVMTTVYGVTKFGARLQIARQLKDLENFPSQHVWNASLYLVQNTFLSLRTMFKSAREIQDWFSNCAGAISSKGYYLEWVTPLGLPVIQPYSRMNMKHNFKDIFFDSYEKPNSVKQKNAFAPNFIHSLDSCHMMLTSLHCENIGLTFVSVHDCFWTHPSTVTIMNRICREQFVALHSEPILDNLSKFFVEKYSKSKTNTNDQKNSTILLEQKTNHLFSRIPKKGSFELKKVLESTYFFS